MEEKYEVRLNLSTFVHRFGNITADGVEDRLSSLLLSNEARISVALDGPLNWQDFDDGVFDAIMSNKRIKRVVLLDSIEANCLSRLLHHSLAKMTNLEDLTILGCPLSTSEAEKIFEGIHCCRKFHLLAFLAMDYSNGVVKALERFIEESSSLLNLVLMWYGSMGGDRIQINQSEVRFRSICEAIGKSASLKRLEVVGAPVNEEATERAIDSLARAIVHCTPLLHIILVRDGSILFPMDRLWSALLGTSAAKNFDFGFCEAYTGVGAKRLVLMRTRETIPWKSLLSQDISLGLWPRILAKTNDCCTEASHSSLDAVFFLTKEKCDVLLQNVRRRRIRKRKRFQFT